MKTADDTTATRAAGGRLRSGAAGAGDVVLDRYRLLRRLGAGGFGVVWLAHDEHLDRAVAVKRVVLHDEATAARAEREARAAARLAHPGIVALYESGRDEEALHLVSELVRGRTLAALLADGALSDRDVLGIGIALCDALEHAHARGVVHRDVKPSNVIVPDAAGGDVPGAIAKLTDFGVASLAGDEPLTVTGDVVGTLAYMAPEQAEGRPAGAEADLYALGLVVFEGLAGVNPVRGAGAASTARNVGRPLPPLGRLRRDLDPDLCAAVDRAVLPEPEGRGTVRGLRDALADAVALVDDAPGAIAPAPIERLARRPPGRRRRLAARLAAGLAAGALCAAGAAAWPTGAVDEAAAGAAAAAAVALLPRLGWLAAAAVAAAWLSVAEPAVALVVLAAIAPVPLLLPREGVLWSAPAAAPLLGVAGLGPAWAALAGQASGWRPRAALGALGGWWSALWSTREVAEALAPGALASVVAWAAAAALLPVLVRGRSAALDLPGVVLWGAGLAAAAEAGAPGSGWAAVPAALLALVLRARRGGAQLR